MRRMLSGAHRVFCEGIVRGLPSVEAYAIAYPKAAPKSVASNAHRLMENDGVTAEIQRLREKADHKAGSAVLSLKEKREFIARVLRSKITALPHDSDLFNSYKRTLEGFEYRIPDKLAAIKLDNDLSGEGKEAEGNAALAELVRRIRK